MCLHLSQIVRLHFGRKIELLMQGVICYSLMVAHNLKLDCTPIDSLVFPFYGTPNPNLKKSAFYHRHLNGRYPTRVIKLCDIGDLNLS